MRSKARLDDLVAGSVCGEVVTKVRQFRKIWTDLENAMNASVFVMAPADLAVLDPFVLFRALSDVKSGESTGNQIDPDLLTSALEWASQLTAKARADFDHKLRELCSSAGVTITGREPSYLIERFLPLRMSTDKGVCQVGSKKIRSLLAERIWLEIHRAIVEERSREVSSADILELLCEAYLEVSRRKGTQGSEPAPIKEVFAEIARVIVERKLRVTPAGRKSFKYSEELFRRDLSRLVASGELVTRGGLRLNLLPTSFAKHGLSIVDGLGVRIVGRIAFSGETE